MGFHQNATVGIVGLGYVGLPLAMRFSSQNIKVIGFDIDIKKIKSIRDGQSYITHIDHENIQRACHLGFKVFDTFDNIAHCDAIILCLPTPIGIHNEPDLSAIEKTLESLRPFLKKGHILSLESTSYPGTTNEIVHRFIEDQGFVVGQNFSIVYSPEREDPGNLEFQIQTIPKLVSGVTKNCLEDGLSLYKWVAEELIPVPSPEVAELAKLLENIYRSVNIGLVNEMKIIADKLNIDIFDVIEAAATKPFGFKAFKPGPGLGGHCIPVDPFYLSWKAKEFGVDAKFVELAGAINRDMPKFVVKKIIDTLITRNIVVKGARILLLGLAYKPNIGDTRESPSIVIFEKLLHYGISVEYHDPYVPTIPEMRNYKINGNSVVLEPDKLSDYDAVVLLADHDCFDYSSILKNAKIIIDTRGRFNLANEKIVRA